MREREEEKRNGAAYQKTVHTDDGQQRRDKTAKVASKTAARRFLKRMAPRSCLVRRRETEEAPRFSECGGRSATLSECRFPRDQSLPDDGVLLPRLARARCEDGTLLPRTSGCLETTAEGRAGRKVDREGRKRIGRGSWDVQAACSDKRRH